MMNDQLNGQLTLDKVIDRLMQLRCVSPHRGDTPVTVADGEKFADINNIRIIESEFESAHTVLLELTNHDE
jgi:hypothetical protein